MAVYVDTLFKTLRQAHWPYDQACHLVADSVEELLAFATEIGLRRAWFQRGSVLPHFDLTKGKRAQAVRAGAAEITREEMGQRINAQRAAQ